MLKHKKCGNPIIIFRMIGLGKYEYAYWFCCMACDPEGMVEKKDIDGL